MAVEASLNIAQDGLRIFMARVVAGQDDGVGARLSRLGHQRPLAGVALAAAPKDAPQTPAPLGCPGPQARQNLLQRIGRVGIVDDDGGQNRLGEGHIRHVRHHPLHPTRHRPQARQRLGQG